MALWKPGKPSFSGYTIPNIGGKVARKKKAKEPPSVDELFEQMEEESQEANTLIVEPITEADEQAFIFTKLFKVINPLIDEEKTFDIVYEMIQNGFGMDDVMAYGEMIRATALETDTKH